jgi:hypothetical protein
MEKPCPFEEAREMTGSASASLSQSHETHDSKDGVMDPRNPQNWSTARKALVFVSLMSSSLLADG